MEKNNEQEEQHLNELWEESSMTEWVIMLKAGYGLEDIIPKTRLNNTLPKKSLILCADGRCIHDGSEISLAGSGILMAQDIFDRVMTEKEIEVITSHDQCGAAALAYNKALAEGTLPEGISNGDEYGRWWSEQMAMKYGKTHRHVSAKDFNDPLHHERGIIFDATLKLHPSLYKGMPNMFVANTPRYGIPWYTEAVVKALTQIGLGDHAFGAKRFNKNDPFYIIIGARDKEELDNLNFICQKSLREFGDKTKILGTVFS